MNEISLFGQAFIVKLTSIKGIAGVGKLRHDRRVLSIILLNKNFNFHGERFRDSTVSE